MIRIALFCLLLGGVFPSIGSACSLKFPSSAHIEAHQHACMIATDIEQFFLNIGHEIAFDNEIVFYTKFGNVLDHNDFYGAHVIHDGSIHVPYMELFDLEDFLFGVPITPDVTESILVHELFHSAINRLLDGNHEKLTVAWHEFAAYCGQFHFMPEYLREEIFAANQSGIGPFKSEGYVNQLILSLDVDWFAISAYRTCEYNGMEAMLTKIINQEVYQVKHDSIP